jgi:hypothetical protein
MAYLNNIYGNAAMVGFYAGMLAGQTGGSAVATDYLRLKNAAVAMAIDVDALIVFDALVSTAMGITQLAITTNTIAANEQFRAGLLQALCYSQGFQRPDFDATGAGLQLTQANAIFAAWTEGLLGLVVP